MTLPRLTDYRFTPPIFDTPSPTENQAHGYLDLSMLNVPVSEAGKKGPIAILNPRLSHGQTAARILLLCEFFDDLTREKMEPALRDGSLPALSIRADQFRDETTEARSKKFTELLENLSKYGLINDQTEIYIQLHGAADNDTLTFASSVNPVSVKATNLFKFLRRSADDAPSSGCIQIYCCQSKILHQRVRDYPHSFLFFSGSGSPFSVDCVDTMIDQINFSAQHAESPPHPEAAWRRTALISGENVTLAGNGQVQTCKMSQIATEEIAGRPEQLRRLLAAKFDHGKFDTMIQLMIKHDISPLGNLRADYAAPFYASLHAEKDPGKKLLLMIALGVDVNKPFDNGLLPLHVVCNLVCHPYQEILAKILLQHGANPDLKIDGQPTPREHAIKRCEKDIIVLYQKFDDGERFTNFSMKSFFFCLGYLNNDLLMNFLIENNSNFLQLTDDQGDSFLSHAIRNDNFSFFSKMVDFKYLVNSANSVGDTPLHLACLREEHAYIYELINAGASVNAVNHMGDTPLMIAAREGNLPVITSLLAAGAAVNHQNQLGETALHAIAQKKSHDDAIAYTRRYTRRDVLQQLLDAGSNADIQNTLGETAFDIAQKSGDSHMASLLKTAQRPVLAGSDRD